MFVYVAVYVYVRMSDYYSCVYVCAFVWSLFVSVFVLWVLVAWSSFVCSLWFWRRHLGLKAFK